MQQIMATGSDVLDTIMQHKAREVAAAKSQVPITELHDLVTDSPACRGFVDALKTSVNDGRNAVIAEVKKASPSKGVIRADFDPVEIALSYQQHGATCLSVLTDQKFFQGSSNYFTQVRQACSIPMLRKDFILDPYQIIESRVMGADCILLIVAALTDDLLYNLAELAIEMGMDVLVEVHNHHELKRGLQLNLPMIGINNRNLRTFATSLATTIDLLDSIPQDVLVVTESGLQSKEDIDLMRQHSVHSFLIGEAFMRANNPGEKLAELFN